MVGFVMTCCLVHDACRRCIVENIAVKESKADQMKMITHHHHRHVCPLLVWMVSAVTLCCLQNSCTYNLRNLTFVCLILIIILLIFVVAAVCVKRIHAYFCCVIDNYKSCFKI